MSELTVAILGATGEVGKEMLNSLLEHQIPIKELRLFASKRSTGQKVAFGDKELVIETLTTDCFEGIDVVLCALDDDIARIYLPEAKKQGCLIIDNSSIYRLDEDVPLVVPEVNPDDIFTNQGIIANPNCSTIIALVAIAQLHKKATINSMIVSTYQAVSGAGKQGIEELETQVVDISEGKSVTPHVFPYQIAYNLIPQIGGFNAEGHSSEEMKLQNEGRKILHHPTLDVTCTCVRVPVVRSHSEAITLFLDNDLSVEEARQIISETDGVKLVDDLDNQGYPMPLDTSNQDLVYVGRIRKSKVGNQSVITLWCCGDQVRKGAATNAVQILEHYIKHSN
ncbi:aspartate-semialdehyde dehydrogenase [Vagococcus sp. CY52-2]|uniref:aspartate-semialdehyde dehydrogenase n=1 Tax=Vagococcus sp. CY52-2 TaxID=2925838 RepID=UPI001F57141F|nr:aspartate-semialdehyde dehydrogenase [Vagococcus sp. CY52-2]UNM90286.1 aspartate-semialdehyde dehydrogenase [Vagococcus sp. CY52-2]